jgi:hypothetical protein
MLTLILAAIAAAVLVPAAVAFADLYAALPRSNADFDFSQP